MREVLEYIKHNPPLHKKLRQTLERWRDMLQPMMLSNGKGLDFDCAPHDLKKEIEEVLK